MNDLSLDDLRNCFEGAVPAIIATAAADGTPNITYLSRVRLVDPERVALSNQFFSKTARNLAENPRASVLVVDPTEYDEFRLTLQYERTEKRGPVFEQLRADIEALASLEGPTSVFKLRAADIYRVTAIEQTAGAQRRQAGGADATGESRRVQPSDLVELTTSLTRCRDLDTLVASTVDGLARVFGYTHSMLMLLDESGTRLYTIASHGYEEQGVGSEVTVGEGIAGMAASRGQPIRIGNLRQMTKYANTVRAMSEDATGEPEIPVPVLPRVQSRLAVPAMAFGQLVGVLVVESDQTVAFDDNDEGLLTVVASLVANAVEAERTHDQTDDGRPSTTAPHPTASGGSTHVRFYRADGSTFVDGDYLIKGVAGRILWALLTQHAEEGRTEFTNREVRLDPSLELPEFRDNFESRLILLKRRLDERDAPIRIEKTGRGRFALVVDSDLRLEASG
ncbi:MAG: GAF domain-containing protein [Acidimicrobiia bacterium]|nr:GAF domain-containing protein [Acidimicrobiia bacterium]MBV9039553.1 GAF domain-containing protein [Acidimicrobiia bacterium]